MEDAHSSLKEHRQFSSTVSVRNGMYQYSHRLEPLYLTETEGNVGNREDWTINVVTFRSIMICEICCNVCLLQ